MPCDRASEYGAATLVLPLGAIAAVVTQLVAGAGPNAGLGLDELEAN